MNADDLVLGVVSGGAVNVSVLVWLALQYVKLTNKVTAMQRDIYYLRREVAYVNGRAEPDDIREIHDNG
jgi:hypothetical protein